MEYPLNNFYLSESHNSKNDIDFDKVYILNEKINKTNNYNQNILFINPQNANNNFINNMNNNYDIKAIEKLLNEERNKNNILTQKINLLENTLNQKIKENNDLK